MKNLEQILEGILFAYGESVSLKKLSEITKKPASDIVLALESLSKNMEGRGIKLIGKNSEWQLAASAEAGEYIEKLIKSEIQEELTPAGLEVLSIVAYRGPVSKNEIELIRGVNSGYTLRNLYLRGLVEKKENSKPFNYEISLAALRKLGLEKIEELPGYNDFKKEIHNAETALTQTINNA